MDTYLLALARFAGKFFGERLEASFEDATHVALVVGLDFNGFARAEGFERDLLLLVDENAGE